MNKNFCLDNLARKKKQRGISLHTFSTQAYRVKMITVEVVHNETGYNEQPDIRSWC